MTAAERLRAFAAENTLQRGPKCRACQLPGEIKEAMRQIRAEGTTTSVIAAWLKREGHEINSASVARCLREHAGR